MSRVETLAVEKWSPDLRAATRGDQVTPLEQGMTRMLAHNPEVALAFVKLAGAIKMNRTISERLAELTRLRIAFHNQCRSCMAIRYSEARGDGVDENLVCSLEKPQESTDLTAAEKVAVRYADLLATDHLAISDELYDELREYYSEAQIVELGVWCAMCTGFGRLAATWQMIEELPTSFQGKGGERLAPWNNDYIEVGASGTAAIS
jgi:alkylhydroperoxidase family enzyme